MTVAQDTKLNANGLPLLPLDLSASKLPIALHWTPIVLTSGILPVVGYFALHYGTALELNIVFAPWLGLMGAVSLFALCQRSYFLTKKDSNCRPLGAQESRWGMDFFGWNFLFGFLALTAVITAGIVTEIVRVVALPLSVLLLYVCAEILLAPLGMAAGIKAPFRISSVPSGAPLRPATYAIVEDVVAVDGKQGVQWRQAWSDRYEASAVLRAHLTKLDYLWGTTGLAVVAVVWGVVFGVENHDVGYVVGWILPWVWAASMSVVTTMMSKSMLKREGETQRFLNA